MAYGGSVVLALCVGLALAPALTGCARHSSQNVYQEAEVGRTTAVSFGTVVAVRNIDIVGKSTGAGAVLGGASGAAAGTAIGSGSGNGAAIAGGLVAGIIVGAMAEQALRDRTGMEYTVVLESGVTLTVAQEMGKGDLPINAGDRVIVQNSGGYQRVLPAANLPTAIQRPKGIKIIDGPQP
jgi:outer membrane lipoprotein SlyB